MINYPTSKELLSDFMNNFFGYGNLNSPYWFIGKEEGGGKNLDENFRRIHAWEYFGKPTTVDLIDYHLKLGFTDKQLNNIQSTWTKLIQILLSIEGKEETKKERRFYQRNHLGRLNGNNCCLELMPMASRSTGLWLWEKIFQEYYQINDRKEYFSSIVPNRIKRLKELIKKYNPELIVFYSTQNDYIQKWNDIVDVRDWQWVQLTKFMKYGWFKRDSSLYVITTHPTMKGITNKDFPEVGKFIKQILFL